MTINQQNQIHQNQKKNQKIKDDLLYEDIYEEEDIDLINLIDIHRKRDTMLDYDSFDYINER